MFVKSKFHKLNNSISFDFHNFGFMELSHSFDMCAPSITLINRNYSNSAWFNIAFVNARQLLRRLYRTYTSSKLDFDRIAFKYCRSL